MFVCCRERIVSLKKTILNINCFESSVNDNDQHRWNLIATRVYLLIFILSLITVGLFSWLRPETTTLRIKYPTKDQFEGFPPDARCSCSRVSVSYRTFVSIDASFHAVCSSDLVSDRWMKSLSYDLLDPKPANAKNFRTIGGAQFQSIAGFCRLSKSGTLRNIASFSTKTLFSPEVLSENIFNSKVKTSIDQFKLTTPNSFGKQVELIREMTVGNQLLNGLQTNVFLAYYINTDNTFKITISKINGINIDGSECQCLTDIDCKLPMGIYQNGSKKLLMKIPGLFAGCRPVDSILVSTLECFYDQTCLDRVISFFPTKERFTAMTLTNQTRFQPNSTVKSIVDQFMVEEWTTNVSYEKYYAECAPTSCIYSKVQRHDFVYLLTKLIGILSGLTIALRFFIPLILTFIRRISNRQETAPIQRKLNSIYLPV